MLGFYRECILLYIQEAHLGLLLFWIIGKRRIILFIGDESALKFFESPMIVLYGSFRVLDFKVFKDFMCPRIIHIISFQDSQNI